MGKKTKQLVAEARRGKPLPWNENKEKLKGWRTALDLSQKQLADEVGVSQAVIAQIETGRRAFKEPQRTKIWEAIGAIYYRRALEPNPTGIFGFLVALAGGTGQLSGLDMTPWERVSFLIQQREHTDAEEIKELKASNRLAWDNVRVLVDLLDRETYRALEENEKEAVEGIRENVKQFRERQEQIEQRVKKGN